MKTTQEVFKEILTETGFGNYKPSEMSNSDYWMCTEKAMERYANEFSIGFVEWSDNLKIEEWGEKTTKELLEIYKKQQ